jgi:hypothetical protein
MIFLNRLKKRLFNKFGSENVVKLIEILSFFTTPFFRWEKLDKFVKYTVGIEGKHTFFGYYDKSPLNYDNRYLLFIQTENSKPQGNECVSVGYFSMLEKEFKYIDKTDCWSWQLGSRLQWFPDLKSENVLYNKSSKGKYISVVRNILTKEIIETFPYPIYDVDFQGNYGLTTNFSRLNRLRPGYGYSVFLDKTSSLKAPKDDGIWLCNLKQKEKKLIISYYELSKISSSDSYTSAEHYVNALSFSPKSKKFAFLHVMHMHNKKRIPRLFVSDLDGENIHLLVNGSTHFTWKNDNEILSYVKDGQEGSGYYLFNLKTGEVKKLFCGLDEDGHPTYSKDQKFLITDNYYNKFSRLQEIFLYEIEKERKKTLLKQYIPYGFSGSRRCDFHPRLSFDNSSIICDAPEKNVRAMKLINLDKSS